MSLFSAPCNGTSILVIQHSELAPGGNFCRGLAARGARLTVINPYAGTTLPAGTDRFDGLVVLGGPQHAFDDEAGPHFIQLMELMRLFDQHRKPVAGICLGGQLLARAHGGGPGILDALEFGFIQHRLTWDGALDPLLGGIALPALMEFHEDTLVLPAGARLLIEGEQCRNQCFKVGHVSYGFQPHLEVDLETAENWIHHFQKGELEHYGRYRILFNDAFFVTLRGKLRTFVVESEAYCDRIAENWLALTARRHSLGSLRGRAIGPAGRLGGDDTAHGKGNPASSK